MNILWLYQLSTLDPCMHGGFFIFLCLLVELLKVTSQNGSLNLFKSDRCQTVKTHRCQEWQLQNVTDPDDGRCHGRAFKVGVRWRRIVQQLCNVEEFTVPCIHHRLHSQLEFKYKKFQIKLNSNQIKYNENFSSTNQDRKKNLSFLHNFVAFVQKMGFFQRMKLGYLN